MYFTDFNLSESLQKAISDMGFEEATPIQAEAIPPALEGRDLIGCAPTGTGKTVAFLLPALERLRQADGRAKSSPGHPGRLASWLFKLQKRPGVIAHTSLRVAAVYGGDRMRQQTDKLRRGVV
jgi:superfamily II DNA/RNA helicase